MTEAGGAQHNPTIASIKESNLLIQFLGGSVDRPIMPIRSRAKDAFLHPQSGALLLASLAKMNRVRFHGTLAYLEIGASGVAASDVCDHIASLSDRQLLERVIQHFGEGEALHHGLTGVLRRANLRLRARAIWRMNNLLSIGAAPNAILTAAQQGRLDVHLITDLAAHLLPVTLAVSHLFKRDREVLAFDQLARVLQDRTGGELPRAARLVKLSSPDALREALDNMIAKFGGRLPTPEINHPRLVVARSTSDLRRIGVEMGNCLSSRIVFHHRCLVTGSALYAVYRAADQRIMLRFTKTASGFEIFEAAGPKNEAVDAASLVAAMADLSTCGTPWRLAPAYVAETLQLRGSWLEHL